MELIIKVDTCGVFLQFHMQTVIGDLVSFGVAHSKVFFHREESVQPTALSLKTKDESLLLRPVEQII